MIGLASLGSATLVNQPTPYGTTSSVTLASGKLIDSNTAVVSPVCSGSTAPTVPTSGVTWPPQSRR